MSSPVQTLNDIAGKTPRRSPRKRRADHQDGESSNKRRISGNNDLFLDDGVSTDLQGTQKPAAPSGKNLSKLKRRSTNATTSSVRKSRSGDFEVPDEQEEDKSQEVAGKVKPKRMRQLRGKKNNTANPLEGLRFDAIISDKVTLTSFNSPLKKPKRTLPKPADPTRKSSRLSGQVIELEQDQRPEDARTDVPRSSAIGKKLRGLAEEEEADAEESQHRDRVMSAAHERSTKGQPETENAAEDDDQVEQDYAAEQHRTSKVPTSKVKTKSPASRKMYSKPKTSVILAYEDQVQDEEDVVEVHTDEDPGDEPGPSTKAMSKSPKKAVRKKAPLTEEEKQKEEDERAKRIEEREAKKQAKEDAAAKAREANAAASHEDYRNTFKQRSAEFMEKIQEPAEHLGVAEALSNLGGGALTVAALAQDGDGSSSRNSKCKRVRAVGTVISELKYAYMPKKGNDQEQQRPPKDKIIKNKLQELRELCDRGRKEEGPYLDPTDRDDEDALRLVTVRGLYLSLIPRCTMLLRTALQVRWDDGLELDSYKELRKLTRALYDLCVLAKEWHPRPSTLDTGVLQVTRQKIHFNVEVIYERLGDFIIGAEQIKHNEAEKLDWQMRVEQARRLRLKRPVLATYTSRIEAVMPTKPQTEPGSELATSIEEHVYDIGDLDVGTPEPKSVSNPLRPSNEDDSKRTIPEQESILTRISDRDLASRSKGRIYTPKLVEASTQRPLMQSRTEKGKGRAVSPEAAPRLERKQTEEIPAPSSTTVWTEIEDVALLNGLQQFTDEDRFTDILTAYDELCDKDLDDVRARALYYRRAMGERVKQPGNEWLRSVTD